VDQRPRAGIVVERGDTRAVAAKGAAWTLRQVRQEQWPIIMSKGVTS